MDGSGGWLAVARRWLRGREALDAWLDALFPPRCAGCGREGAHFCPACVAAVKPVPPPWCHSCGQCLPAAAARSASQLGFLPAQPRRGSRGSLPSAGGLRTADFGQVPLCLDCRLHPLPLVAVRSAGAFEGPLRHAIHRLKYRGRRDAARALGELLVSPATALRTTWPAPPTSIDARHIVPIIVAPVPLHPRRERERGYNQAALLAAPLCRALGWPLDAHALRRIKDTAPLVGLSAVQRAAAVAGAFAATRSVAGKHVLLVDDVATTCSTLASAARACLSAGAASVTAVTLARETKRLA